MIKSRETKIAFLASMFSMIMCLTMLIGSTYAWFSDSVVSGNNKIVAGNLDVELYHKNGNMDKEALVDEKTKLFMKNDGNSVNWEPGVLVYENFTIKNAGSLAFKYHLMMNAIDNWIEVDGKRISLKDVLKVAILDNKHIPDDATREQILKDDTIQFNKKFTDFNKTGEISVGGEPKKYAIVIYWQENGNDDIYNLKMGQVTNDQSNQLSIDLSVSLFATQHNDENDSFGNDYDSGLAPSPNGSTQKLDNGANLNYRNDGEIVLTLAANGDRLVNGIFNVPSGVTAIGSNAFYNRKNIKKVILPSTVRTLEFNAFCNTSAETIVLNDGLTTIGLSAFKNATNLSNINIPSTVTSIGGNSFQGSGLDNLMIPATVNTIHASAFRDMPNLTTLTIEGNSYIAEYAAKNCPELTKVYLKGENVTFGRGQLFTRNNDGDARGITIYVKNKTVKARVEFAQFNATGYKVEVDPDM